VALGKGKYFLGDKFTLADIYLATALPAAIDILAFKTCPLKEACRSREVPEATSGPCPRRPCIRERRTSSPSRRSCTLRACSCRERSCSRRRPCRRER
ncbi:MAG: hypothetical protein II650_05180, partial [Clostridia bacterium]|nr:hypothetical protein [Clostridia bacterium]